MAQEKQKSADRRTDRRRSSQDGKLTKMDISFSGAGFMGVYYFGVNNCWEKYIPRDRVGRTIGASAGSLSAAYMAIGLPLPATLSEILQFGEDIRSRPLGAFDPKHKVVDELPKKLDRVFPPDAHKQASGKLHVVMTRLKDMKKVVVNEFETRQDLIDALNCSCYIPVWSGNRAPTFKGEKYIDGGFKDNQPVFDEHTIKVCCFSGATDISPYDSKRAELLTAKIRNTPVNLNWGNMKRMRRALFPPPAPVLCELVDRGYHDTKQFILDNDLIQCDKCYRSMSPEERPIYSKITPTISPAVSPRSLSPAHSATDLDKGERKQQKPLTVSPDGHLSASNVVNDRQDRVDNPKMTKQERMFGSLLRDKLDRYSPESALGNSVESIDKSARERAHDAANTPFIVVSGEGADERQRADSTSDYGASSGSPVTDIEERKSVAIKDAHGLSRKRKEFALHKRASLGEISALKKKSDYLTRRRQTVANLAEKVDDTSDLESESSSVATADRFKPASSPLPSCPPSPNLNRKCAECSRLRQKARLDGVDELLKAEIEKYRKPMKASAHDNRLVERVTNPWRWIKQIGLARSYSFDAAKATVAL